MVAAKIKVVDLVQSSPDSVDPVDMVKPWVEAEVEVVKAGVDGDVRRLLDKAFLTVAVTSTC